ncbi:MAG: HSP20 family protein [Candidatus Binatia bacterium]|jgi:HSP20 family protein
MKLMRMRTPRGFGGFGLSRWNGLEEEIDRLFNAPFAAFAGSPEVAEGWTPALDLVEDKESFVATVELPGLKKDGIEVSFEEGVLTISGERKVEERKEIDGVHRTERVFGTFSRSVRLPKPVNEAKVKAAYKDGILTVSLPIAEIAKPKQIEVKVN